MGFGSMQLNWKSSICSQQADLGSETGKHRNYDNSLYTDLWSRYSCLQCVLQVSRASSWGKVFDLYVKLSAVSGLVQQASDTKDGGSKIMESFSSMDEGDQQVGKPFYRETLVHAYLTALCFTLEVVHQYPFRAYPQRWACSCCARSSNVLY